MKKDIAIQQINTSKILLLRGSNHAKRVNVCLSPLHDLLNSLKFLLIFLFPCWLYNHSIDDSPPSEQFQRVDSVLRRRILNNIPMFHDTSSLESEEVCHSTVSNSWIESDGLGVRPTSVILEAPSRYGEIHSWNGCREERDGIVTA